MLNLKKGYNLLVETWENDGDNYNTEVVNGSLTVLNSIATAILPLFYRDSPHSNKYEMSKTELNHLMEVLGHAGNAFHLDFWDGLPLSERPEANLDGLYELGITKGEFDTRVVERWSIVYLPEEPSVIRKYP